MENYKISKHIEWLKQHSRIMYCEGQKTIAEKSLAVARFLEEQIKPDDDHFIPFFDPEFMGKCGGCANRNLPMDDPDTVCHGCRWKV